jgi:hypothetical protein
MLSAHRLAPREAEESSTRSGLDIGEIVTFLYAASAVAPIQSLAVGQPAVALVSAGIRIAEPSQRVDLFSGSGQSS